MYEKLMKLNEYKVDLGRKSFKLSRDDITSGTYADAERNASLKRLNPLIKAITNNNVEMVTQKSGLSTYSKCAFIVHSKYSYIIWFGLSLIIGIPLRNTSNNNNYNNNNNNYNYNNNNNRDGRGGRCGNCCGRGGNRGSRNYDNYKLNSCHSTASKLLSSKWKFRYC